MPADAQEVPGTGSDFGGVGLLEMRNARFRPDGTLEAGTSLRHQRRLWFVNFQALPWLEATFRVAERLDGTTGRGMTSDRSFDVKLRLVEEDDLWPAVAIGLQDFIGTGIYGGEYIVASKRFGPLDVTAGVGWGRLGTYDDLRNPLTLLSPRFEQRDREVGEGGLLGPGTYFRGESASLFGGLEYSLPPLWTPLGSVEGLRAKVEFSGDALRDERGGYPANTTNLAGQARSRVNYGLQWSNGWLDVGAGWLHGTDFVLRLSARFDPANPPEAEQQPPPALSARPLAPLPDPEQAARDALRVAGFRPVAVRIAGAEAHIAVAGGSQRRLAQAAGRAMRAVQPFLPAEVQRVVFSWRGGARPGQRRGAVLRRGAWRGGRGRIRPHGWRVRLHLGHRAAPADYPRRSQPDAALAGLRGGGRAGGTRPRLRAGRQPLLRADRQSRWRATLRQPVAARAQRLCPLRTGRRRRDPGALCGARLGTGARHLRARDGGRAGADVQRRLGRTAVAAL
jgi:hypothetical protein